MESDQHITLLVPAVDIYTRQVRLTDVVCYILIILGIVGNILGLFIFSSSRRTWRISSVYACLATCSSITNLLCVLRYTSILHSTSRHILRELVGQTWWGCKLYEISFSFRVISSWITLFWMFERLICVSTKLRLSFNHCNSFTFKFIIPIIMIILILICVIGPPVYMYQPKIMSGNGTLNSTMNMMYCGISPNASVKWKKYFQELHLGMNHFTIRCLFSELIPTGAIILFNSYIIYHLIQTYHRFHQTSDSEIYRNQSRTASWMNIVLILHSFLFLSSLLSHIVGHFTGTEAHETWWVLLAVLINCSLNFYIYCLSGKAFRNEIHQLIQRIKTRILHGTQIRQQPSCQNQRFIYEMSNCQVVVQL